MNTHTHTHARTHARTHTHAHTHTHTHTVKRTMILSPDSLQVKALILAVEFPERLKGVSILAGCIEGS